MLCQLPQCRADAAAALSAVLEVACSKLTQGPKQGAGALERLCYYTAAVLTDTAAAAVEWLLHSTTYHVHAHKQHSIAADSADIGVMTGSPPCCWLCVTVAFLSSPSGICSDCYCA